MNCDVFTDADAVEGCTSGLLSFKELSALAMRPDLPL
jgi:hypothetical protein